MRSAAEGAFTEMAKVKVVGDAEASSWEATRDRLLGLLDGRSVALDVDDDTWLIVLHIAEFGYMVTGCGEVILSSPGLTG